MHFARLFSRPLRWLTGSSHVESMKSRYAGSLTQKGIGLGGRVGASLPHFAFEASSCSLCGHALSDVEGGGLLADG